VKSEDVAWAWGRPVLGGSTAIATRLRSYGADRIPRSGGVVLAFNHFSWIDISCVGWATTRNIYFLAKVEAHGVPGLGQLIRSFGTLAVMRTDRLKGALPAHEEPYAWWPVVVAMLVPLVVVGWLALERLPRVTGYAEGHTAFAVIAAATAALVAVLVGAVLTVHDRPERERAPHPGAPFPGGT